MIDARPRRILMTVDAVGGVWRYAMELAASLKAVNYETLFVGFGPEPSPAQRHEAECIGEIVWQKQPLDWMAESEHQLGGVGEVLETLADTHQIDLLHLNLPSQAAQIRSGRRIVTVSHSCVVTWWQAMRSEPLPVDWQWKRALNQKGFEAADAIISPSASHAALLRACYEIDEVSIVHNAMACDLNSAAKEPYAFAAGRWWDESKNARILDMAAPLSPWEIKVAGSTRSPSGGEVFLSNVTQLGELSHAELIDKLRRAAIVVSPSIYEPFGLLALEGARASAALVLADIPTYRELWADCALFFDPHDADALATVLARLSRDRELRQEMGLRALARSLTYSPERQASAMAALYENLLAETKSPMARRA